MLYLQNKYSGLRIWRFDNGQAYAKFSVKGALQEYKRTGSITQAMKQLIVITYGNEGFPDLAGIYHGIFIGIEIKVGKDKQRKAQKVMEEVINNAGGVYMIVDDKSPLDIQMEKLEGIREWKNKQ